MAFKFSLATVLRVRTIAEEREERLLQQILQQMASKQQAADKADSDIAALNASRASAVRKTFMALHLHASYVELEQLTAYRKTLEEQLVKLRQFRDTQIAAYSTARRNREMLTEMRAQKHDLYDAAVAAKEQRALDDNFIARKRRAS